MSLLSNTKTVVGLFDNDSAVEQAVSALQQHGFGQDDNDEILIVDKNRLPQETPVGPSGQVLVTPSPNTPGRGGVAKIPNQVEEGSGMSTEISVQDELTGRGFNSETAEFFAQHVAQHGSRLVIVETEAGRAGEAHNAMETVGVGRIAMS